MLSNPFPTTKKSVEKKMSSRIRKYGIAALATLFAWLVDILLEERFSESSGGLYVAAALLSTWIGGWGPGLLAVGLTVGLNLTFYDRPELSLAVGAHGFERLILFSVVALVTSGLAARVRKNQQQLRELNARLEKMVQIRTAALNESNRQLEAFCYTLAHDLRAPLRAIEGFAEILMIDHGSELPANIANGVQRIRNSAERMGRLILDLLAYTELSRENFQKRPVDLDAAVRKILRLFADEIERTHAEISIKLSATRILGDPTGIERVLINLIANSLKFSSPNRPLRVRILSEAESPDVRVSIVDNGIGIDPRYRERIFGVFERLSAADNPGTGIGLAIVKRSVEKMGGTVGAESTLGEGSRFWFQLSAAPELPPVPVTELAGHEQV
jgi:signal transduction histidine kinase